MVDYALSHSVRKLLGNEYKVQLFLLWFLHITLEKA
jgi:hypothetical protein